MTEVEESQTDDLRARQIPRVGFTACDHREERREKQTLLLKGSEKVGFLCAKDSSM